MKIKELLAALVGLAAAVGAIYYFYKFVTFSEEGGGHSLGWYCLGPGSGCFRLRVNLLPGSRQSGRGDSHHSVGCDEPGILRFLRGLSVWPPTKLIARRCSYYRNRI